MGQSIQEWTKSNLWKAAFKKFSTNLYSSDLQEHSSGSAL